MKDEAQLQKLRDYLKGLGEGAVAKAKIHREVKVFKLTKAWKKDFVKLEVSLAAGTSSEMVWDEVMVPYLKAIGAEIKMGEAPPGDLERRVQEIVDDT